MASLRDIKRRIGSVKSTQKITRAMKMVAASKLRRAQASIQQARPYAYRMRSLVHRIAERSDTVAHPLLRPPPDKRGKVGIVVITSDRGLCGGFNANIVNRVVRELDTTFQGRTVELTVVGRKGVDLLKRRNTTIRQTFRGDMDIPVIRLAGMVIDDLVQEYMRGETAEVHCVYNAFKSAVQQSVTIERLLPLHVDTGEEGEGDNERKHPTDYLYEPSQEDVFTALLEQDLGIQMGRMLYESIASEHGARMTAMDAATRNAGEVIDRLTLAYNRARQDAITTELIEVVSGAEAL